MISKAFRLDCQKGITLIEITIVMGILVALVFIAVNVYERFRITVRDGAAKEDLRRAYKASQAFFTEHPGGQINLRKLSSYGFLPSPNVNLGIFNDTSSGLLIGARHATPGCHVFLINAQGDIFEASQPLLEHTMIGQLRSPGPQIPSGGTQPPTSNDSSEPIALLELRRAYASSLSFFSQNPDGVINKELLKRHGYTPNPRANLAIADGTLAGLSLIATSTDSGGKAFSIDSAGRIH